MTVETLDFAEPFFTVKYLSDEDKFTVGDRSIIVNVSKNPILIQGQKLGSLESVIVADTDIENAEKAIVIERFADYPDEPALFERVKNTWKLAYDVRKEDRLKGVSHYLSPKAPVGDIILSMYHSGSVPLNVGLHKDHTHVQCNIYKEVHTQIVGIGKMQQCREKDVNTLYWEEPMAPGVTHKPMFDENGNYPWHQFETTTPSIFMAIEMPE